MVFVHFLSFFLPSLFIGFILAVAIDVVVIVALWFLLSFWAFKNKKSNQLKDSIHQTNGFIIKPKRAQCTQSNEQTYRTDHQIHAHSVFIGILDNFHKQTAQCIAICVCLCQFIWCNAHVIWSKDGKSKEKKLNILKHFSVRIWLLMAEWCSFLYSSLFFLALIIIILLRMRFALFFLFYFVAMLVCFGLILSLSFSRSFFSSHYRCVFIYFLWILCVPIKIFSYFRFFLAFSLCLWSLHNKTETCTINKLIDRKRGRNNWIRERHWTKAQFQEEQTKICIIKNGMESKKREEKEEKKAHTNKCTEDIRQEQYFDAMKPTNNNKHLIEGLNSR